MASKIIKRINIDFSDIKQAGESRKFSVLGDNGAVFSLEVKNDADYYYNFQTSTFQVAKTRLTNEVISGVSYTGNIKFPTVAAADQYDFYLFSEIIYDTKHATPSEVRFADGSFDANSSSGSNANVVQKVIYQTLDVDIDINGLSGGGDITSYGNPVQTITTSRGKNVAAIPLSITTTVAAGALTIDRQPTSGDIMSFVTRSIDLAPIDILGENISQSIETGTINGARTGAGGHDTVTIDEVAATVAAVGDRITGSDFLNARNVTVLTVSASTGKTFTVSEVITIADGETITFTNQKNYRWGVDSTYGLDVGMEIKATTGAQGNGFTGPATIKEYLDETIVFEGEKGEYRIDNVKLPGLDTLGVKPVITRNDTTKVATTVQTGNITLSQQAENAFGGQSVRIFAYGRETIEKLTGYDVEFSDLKAVLNTVTTTTTAAVNPADPTIPVASKVGIVDKTQQDVSGATTESKFVVLDSVTGLGIGQSLYAVSAGTLIGTPKIVAIDETTNTITLSSVQTLQKNATLTFPNSIISGSGISNTAITPYVDTISLLELEASVAQTLENGQTLTFSGAGDIVTITGNIKVNKVGNEALALRFDIDKFLTQH
tara:strand:- start:847 stop:2658 length:1812 start_codon:yes stop_codon:yes gene_type:complete